MEEEANQLYRRPQMTGLAKDEEEEEYQYSCSIGVGCNPILHPIDDVRHIAVHTTHATYVARVFSSLRVPGAHHVVGHAISVPVRLCAYFLADDWQ